MSKKLWVFALIDDSSTEVWLTTGDTNEEAVSNALHEALVNNGKYVIEEINDKKTILAVKMGFVFGKKKAVQITGEKRLIKTE